MTKIRFSHPTGSPFAGNAAEALYENGLLDKVITCYAHRRSTSFGRLISRLPDKLSNEFSRRAWLSENIPLEQHMLREAMRIALVKTGFNNLLGMTYRSLVDWVYCGMDQVLAQSISQNPPDAVYAYEDGAAEAFAAAKKMGVARIYDLPITAYRTSARIQSEEAERFPELKGALAAANEPQWKLERKDKEIELADLIIAASSATKFSLEELGVDNSKILIVPYGVDLQRFTVGSPQDDVFRVLFVGRIGPRKGVHYLLDAWKKLNLKKAELVLVGINEFPENWFKEALKIPGVKHVPSVPQAELVKYYQNAHVLAFPSLVEGFGMVILEAMACGTPVLTTPRTAGPDIMTQGKDGWLIEPNSSEDIFQALEQISNSDELRLGLRENARAAAEKFTWGAYQTALSSGIKKFMESQ